MADDRWVHWTAAGLKHYLLKTLTADKHTVLATLHLLCVFFVSSSHKITGELVKMLRLKMSWLQPLQLLCNLFCYSLCFLLYFVVLALCDTSCLKSFPSPVIVCPLSAEGHLCLVNFPVVPFSFASWSFYPVCLHRRLSCVFVTVFWTSPLWGDLDLLLLLHWICLLVWTIHPGFDPWCFGPVSFSFNIINHMYWTSVPAASAFGPIPCSLVTQSCSDSTLLLWHYWTDTEEFIVSNVSKPAEEIIWF